MDSLKEKLAYWRENGAPGVIYSGGRQMFHDTTVAETNRRTVAEFVERNGYEPEPISTRKELI